MIQFVKPNIFKIFASFFLIIDVTVKQNPIPFKPMSVRVISVALVSIQCY